MNKIFKWFSINIEDQPELSIATENFRKGLKNITPTLPATLIWAVVTAVAMISAGLSPFYVVLINIVVYAASAQLTVLSMLLLQAPMPIIWLAAAAVNLRFVIFSASIRPYFRHLPLKQRLVLGFVNGDINSMLFGHEFRDDNPAPAKPEQTGFFLGLAIPNYLTWQVGTWLGVIFASFIPAQWGLQLAAALTLLVLILKSVDHWASVAGSLSAALVAVSLQFLPYKLWVIIAILVGVASALMVETLWPNAYLSAVKRMNATKSQGEKA